VAELRRFSDAQVYALVDSGRLMYHRFTTGKNGAIHVSQTQIDAYLKGMEKGALDEKARTLADGAEEEERESRGEEAGSPEKGQCLL